MILDKGRAAARLKELRQTERHAWKVANNLEAVGKVSGRATQQEIDNAYDEWESAHGALETFLDAVITLDGIKGLQTLYAVIKEGGTA